MDCLFCKIIQGEIPCYKVYEDKNVLAFLDINPSSKGHTLVIPKVHIKSFLDLPDSQVADIFLAVKKIAENIKSKLNADGLNVGLNVNKAGGQVVDHLHIHIIPRWKNDGGRDVQSIIKNPPKEELEKVLNEIKM